MPRKPRFKRLRHIRVDWITSRGFWGWAYPDEWRIELDHRSCDKMLMNTIVHEVAHVVLPVLDEAAVKILGDHAADVLWRLGFRRVEKGDE